MAIKQLNTTISQSPEGKSIAKIREIRGKSLVWNQLESVTATSARVSYDSEANTYTSTPIQTPGSAGSGNYSSGWTKISPKAVQGHRYYISMIFGRVSKRTDIDDFTPNPAVLVMCGGDYKGFNVSVGETISIDTILTAKSNSDVYFTNNDCVCTTKNTKVFDLTLMFGAGNEPEAVEEFEAMFPENYYEYNSGEIINNNINAIESVGFNQWDEEMELGTYGQSVNISKVDSTTQLRNVNPIPVFPNTTYCLTCKSNSDGFFIALYDSINSDKTGYGTVIQRTAAAVKTFTTGPKTRYVCFSMAASYGTTYKNDICFSFSDQSRNSTYEAYKKSTLPLNISTLTGKLNGEGESVVICSDGLKSAGSVYDYGIVEDGYLTKIVKVIGEVDMGTLNWVKAVSGIARFAAQDVASTPGYNYAYKDGKSNLKCKLYIAGNVATTSSEFASNNPDRSIGLYYNGAGMTPRCYFVHDESAYSQYDAEGFKQYLSGVMLQYELATPQTYVLDTPILMEYNTDGGTEQIVFSENLLSAPLVADIDYFNNAIKHIQFNNEKHCIRDERITGVDSTPTKNSTNVVSSGGLYDTLKGDRLTTSEINALLDL